MRKNRPTPRTDAEMKIRVPRKLHGAQWEESYVKESFAKALEQELAATKSKLRSEVTRLRKQIKELEHG